MRKPEFRYMVLWVFLFGIIIIVFLQVISGYNINRLVKGNRTVFNELKVQNGLRQLQADILTVESDIRGAAITQKPERLENVELRISAIQKELNNLHKLFQEQTTEKDINKLDLLVNEKVALSRRMLEPIKSNDRKAGELIVNINRSNEIRDSLVTLISQLESSRRTRLQQIVGSIGTTGKNARIWGVFVSGIALIAVIIAFWYITNQGRNQQKMIRALNESDKKSKDLAYMKEQFLANMSHEIRTPMNSILGFTSLLRRTELGQTQRDYVQNIHSAGENLLSLVNDILDLSKIEAGMMQLEETRFSLRGMISSVGAMFIEKMKEKGLDFQVHIDKNTPDIVFGDAVRMTQILVNLVSNAVKFTEQGIIKVNVGLIVLTEKKVRIRITVADTGIGIAPEKQATIFERFQQAEAQTTRRFGGSGLGLSIVKQLVELQKGTLLLKSQLGKGSEFIVELEYKLPDVAQMYSTALSVQEEQVSLQKIRVLIAEDNSMNQHLIAHLMKSWTIEYVLVDNGARAIEALKKKPFSLVLMDIQMPEMDGYTATSIIRNELKMHIPVIAMTAHAMIGEKEKCLQLGMNDYVSKPLKETLLYNIIARYAQRIPENGLGELTCIKLDYLHQLSGNDPNFEREIMEQFVKQVPLELNELKESIEIKDFNRIRRNAHSLKSTVGYVGLAEELHVFLDNLEENATSEDDSNMLNDFEMVKEKCSRALEEVKIMLDNHLV